MELVSVLYREFCASKWWTPAFHVTDLLSLAETAGESYQSAQHWAARGYDLYPDSKLGAHCS